MHDGNVVWYSVGRTIPLERFASIKFEVGESRTVAEGMVPAVLYEQLRDEVDARLNRAVEELQATLRGRTQPAAPAPKAAVAKRRKL